MKNIKTKKLPAFTLLEVAIALLVIGIISAGVFKGQELIESARISSVVRDFEKYRLMFLQYQEMYQCLPGDDSQAGNRFGSHIPSGNGNQIIDSDEANLAWIHLNKAGISSVSIAPSSRMNGVYQFVYQPHVSMGGHWIVLSRSGGNGSVTPKQALSIKSKIDEGSTKPSEGSLQIQNDSSDSSCILNGSVNISNNSKCCIIYYHLG